MSSSMKLVPWHELSPAQQYNARHKDPDCGFREEALYGNWWSDPSKPGGSVLLHEDGARDIQIVSHGSRYFLLRLGSARLIAWIDYDDLGIEVLTANPGEWIDKLMKWARYWDNFDREQCALSVALKEGMPPSFKEKVLYEAKRIDGWFLRYRRADDIYEFTKRKDGGLIYIYIGEYFLGLPQPPVASESNDSVSFDSETWEA